MSDMQKCAAQVYDPSTFHGRKPCQNRGTIERDGRWYCHVHDVDKAKARRAAMDAKKLAERQEQARVQADAERLAARLGGRPHYNHMEGRCTGGVVLSAEKAAEIADILDAYDSRNDR